MRCLFASWGFAVMAVAGWSAEPSHIAPEVFWETGLPWLAPEEIAGSQPREIPVYQLSCASCLESFAAILSGDEEPSAIFLLNTSKQTDREVARVLLAVVLAQPNEANRRGVFRDLLADYLQSPADYLNDPVAWQVHALAKWGQSGELPGGPKPWAAALNRLHAHNRLLGLLDVYRTPSWLSMEEDARRVPADDELETAGLKYLLMMTAEPALQPDWDRLQTSQDQPARVNQIEFNPLVALDRKSWNELLRELERGVLWYWSEDASAQSDWITQWRDKMEALPDYSARRKLFIETFRAARLWKRKGEWSLVEFLQHPPRDR